LVEKAVWSAIRALRLSSVAYCSRKPSVIGQA
jgi:hypothetical protein